MVQLPNNLKKTITQRQPAKAKTPVWEGPNGKGANGGVTSSLLQKFLVCPERFRLQVVEGLTSHDRFNSRLEYGNMWHLCEEALAKGKDPTQKRLDSWETPLTKYVVELCKKYPTEPDSSPRR